MPTTTKPTHSSLLLEEIQPPLQVPNIIPSAHSQEAAKPDLDKVPMMSSKELRELFILLFDHDPPKHARRDFILGNVLYQLQLQEFGGLSARIKKQIEHLIERFEKNPNYRPAGSGPEYLPGTRLMRTYQGKSYEVLVAHDGFIFNGLPYPSLTRIAREITGVSWNGRAFFGVRHGR